MRNIFTIIFILFGMTLSWSQVGINTSSPSATLDVVGNVKIDDRLYLENPGITPTSKDVKLLVKDPSDNIREYDISNSKYGLLNVSEFRFRQTSSYGLYSYDTKIPIDKYILALQGYYFTQPTTGSTNVMLRSTVNSDNIEGHQIYAFKDTTTNTWFLRCFIPNSRFKTLNGNTYVFSYIDIFLSLVIYKAGFITRELPNVSVDMGKSATKTIAPPSGY